MSAAMIRRLALRRLRAQLAVHVPLIPNLPHHRGERRSNGDEA